jgi:hypothetical protein
MSKKKDNEQSIRVVPFSGEKKEWMTCEEKFLAISHIKGFSEIFEMDPEDIPTDSDDLDNEKIAGNNKKRETCEKNRKAYHLLILSMSGDTPHSAVAIVQSKKTADNLFVNAAQGFQQINKRYCPSTAPHLAMLHQMFFSAKNQEGR